MGIPATVVNVQLPEPEKKEIPQELTTSQRISRKKFMAGDPEKLDDEDEDKEDEEDKDLKEDLGDDE